MDQRTKDSNRAIEEAQTEFLRAVKAVSKSDDGVVVLRHLMTMCGFKDPSITANPNTGEINTWATNYNEARRNLWLEFRKLIPKGQRNRIEMDL